MFRCYIGTMKTNYDILINIVNSNMLARSSIEPDKLQTVTINPSGLFLKVDDICIIHLSMDQINQSHIEGNRIYYRDIDDRIEFISFFKITPLQITADY